jgi:hypothetical protein
MTAAESKNLKKGNRVFWRGDAADGGTTTGTSWDAVTIAWDNGQVVTAAQPPQSARSKSTPRSPAPTRSNTSRPIRMASKASPPAPSLS